MPELNYRPERPAKEVWRWNTNVLKSRDGVEHRHSLDPLPRKFLTYQYILPDVKARWLESYLFNNQGATWDIPLWHEGYGTNAVAGGAGSITGDFTYRDITDGNKVLIIDPSATVFEQVTVASSTSTTLTLSGTTSNTYPAGSRVYPVLSAYVTAHNFRPYQTALVRAGLTFEATTAVDAGGRLASLDTYNSKYHLDRRPLETSRHFDMEVRRLDYGLNHVQDASYTWADIIQGRRYLVQGALERQYWEGLLDNVRGGWKSLYVATWRPDLYVRTATGGASSIVVEENPLAPNFQTEWYDHGGHAHIQLDTSTDGTIQRQVTSIVDNGDNLTLNLNAALPSTGGFSVNMVSFLELCTLSDEVAFEHHGGHSIVSVAVKAVQQ